MELVGYRRRRFTAPDSGELITGYYLNLTYEDKAVEGLAVDSVFLSDNKLDGYHPHLGDHLELIYNKYGKVSRVQLLE